MLKFPLSIPCNSLNKKFQISLTSSLTLSFYRLSENLHHPLDPHILFLALYHYFYSFWCKEHLIRSPIIKIKSKSESCSLFNLNLNFRSTSDCQIAVDYADRFKSKSDMLLAVRSTRRMHTAIGSHISCMYTMSPATVHRSHL